jgi:predicted transcriptional regulator
MYLLPQEIEVWYIIPKIRRELSRMLTRRYKFTYEKTGEMLGITKSAVSQYLKNKRANKIRFSKELQSQIALSAKRIYENNSYALIEIQNLLRKMKETRCACDVCRKYNKNVLNYCKCEPHYPNEKTNIFR